MAQRSAIARAKLDKTTRQDAQQNPPAQRRSLYGGGGARLGSGGLLTPSASSVSGSSRNSLQLQAPPRVNKGAFRAFLEGKSDKFRRGFVGGHKRDSGEVGNFYNGLGMGFGGSGPSSMSTIGEEKIQVKRWEGSAGRGEVWDGGGKGKKDLELWFPDGDTLVYLTEKPSTARSGQRSSSPPQPSFRLRSAVLRQTASPFLLSQLEESVREQPQTPDISAPSTPALSVEGMDYEYQLQRSRTLETTSSTPSVSTTNTTEVGIKYRLYFPSPSRQERDSKLRYHLTTRNFFAILFNRSLVGITLGQSLLDLGERIDLYLSTETPMSYDMADRGVGEVESPYGSFIGSLGSIGSSSIASAKQQSHPSTHRMILDYLERKEFDDVRGWPEGAAGLLAWSERACEQVIKGNVQMSAHDFHRTEAIWRECFVHCLGQSTQVQGQLEWRDISPITKAMIDRASLEVQVRTQKVDARMAGFNFADMWPVSSAAPPSARMAFDKFQKFLLKHYQSRFGSWPPQEGRLTRTLCLHLQRDFTALYDYLVDRDVAWSPAHNVPAAGRRIMKASQPYWRADDEQLQITDILRAFDENCGHPPMPHPFPLVPASPPSRNNPNLTQNPAPPNKRQQRGFFATPGSSSFRGRTPSNPATALALSESTNIDALYGSATINPLVEAFTAHEKSIPSTDISPHDARKGRWILIYGILQTLASVAVDAPGIKWTEGVEYHLNPKLGDTPPWRKKNIDATYISPDERSHFRSHCWLTIKPEAATSVELPASSPPTSSGSRRPFPGATRSRKLREKRSEVLMDLEGSGDEGDDEMDVASPTSMGPPGSLGSTGDEQFPPPPSLKPHRSAPNFKRMTSRDSVKRTQTET